jgi:hypothetical protein
VQIGFDNELEFGIVETQVFPFRPIHCVLRNPRRPSHVRFFSKMPCEQAHGQNGAPRDSAEAVSRGLLLGLCARNPDGHNIEAVFPWFLDAPPQTGNFFSKRDGKKAARL